MENELISIGCGTIVCLFGIWAFLKGQTSMAEIIHGGKPGNLKGPAAMVKEGRAEAEERAKQENMERQLRSMFSEPGGRK